MTSVQDGNSGVKQVADVIWPKKHPFVVRGTVSFRITVGAEDARAALDFVGEVVDGLQKELAGYWSVKSINEWEVNAENVRAE